MNPSWRVDPARVPVDLAHRFCIAEVTGNTKLLILLWVWDRTLRPRRSGGRKPIPAPALAPVPAPAPPPAAAKAEPPAAAEPEVRGYAERIIEQLQSMRDRHGDSWEQKIDRLAKLCELDLPSLRTAIHEVNRSGVVQILEPHKRGWGHRIVFPSGRGGA